MNQIKIVRQATPEWLNEVGALEWPIQEKESCTFPCFYNHNTSFYILSGQVHLTVSGEDEIRLQAGDFITLPKGAACYWEILQTMRAHSTDAQASAS